jgi:hypothetical protein
MDTNAYLDALKSRYGLRSEYALAKFLEWNPSRLRGYRNRGIQLDEEGAIKVAKLLDLHPAVVAADVQAVRTNCHAAKAVWKEVAERFRGAAIALVFAGLAVVAAAPKPAQAGAAGILQYYTLYVLPASGQVHMPARALSTPRSLARSIPTETPAAAEEYSDV